MTFRNTLFGSILAAGIAVAQTPVSTPPPGGAGMRHGGMMSELQLTDAQKTQVHQIFQESRTAAEPIESQMQDLHKQLAAAVKNGAPETTIEALANQAGALHAQMLTLHAKSAAKVYGLLTPDQKVKADAMGDRFLMMAPGGMGPMGHGPRPTQN